MSRSRGGGGKTRTFKAPAKSAAKAPAPAYHAPPPAPVPQPSAGGIGGGIAATMVDGLVFGAGNAVAHRAADAIMGPRVVQHEMTPSSQAASTPAEALPQPTSSGSDPCLKQFKAFQDCIAGNPDDISKCQFYIDMLGECRRTAGSMV
ncbi:coiled-coil-helix-coiled-coil-helix domain-containing protein 10, mitochondrial isoform X1 [Selaginella moellendorffii]|uniref:coiled-coil-helix-coiled-coil-helix domain-containing protein 10, mitochondrial isoform X1 n=1 Tax=Selaginella moellendorffii TaxID=88036 RepID=UPI000D1C4630|nr:coiled-coil-helix-coiled-coil-helix domain-containing protein 10, mitochondrial isoform X1 [Selaginella moellendorffii]|eukprot:XP_002981832.2 coiled-coil-helix-coiled-coil-helix domain-containing protein 10, mitochondrial isoform X1 [Selaginella moellendorffii]